MRGMIVAAGLGTRLRPLTHLRPKPAVPVRGIPLIAYPLALLAHAGVTEVMINLHHLPDVLRDAAERWAPAGLQVTFSHEPELLHTGGAIARVADFLRESDPCVVVGGDMIVDLDLADLVRQHTVSGRAVTSVLTDHPRAAEFGTMGLDGRNQLRRIGSRWDRGLEEQAGVYTWVNVLSARSFETLPDQTAFNHLDDWWAPWAEREPAAVGGVVLDAAACSWAPVGTPAEYLAANFEAAPLRYLDVAREARRIGAQLSNTAVIGHDAHVDASSPLDRVVVWDGEQVPARMPLHHGVWAGGAFHAVPEGSA